MHEGFPSRFLISRLSAIGDCILTTPVANALRTHFPTSFIAWLVERPAAQLLEGHEAIDELIVLPRGWLKDLRLLLRLRRHLRDLRFDVALDAQSLSRSAIPAWLSGAKTRIGFAPPWGRELGPWLNNRLVPRTANHVVDAMLGLLRPLGIESPDVHFRLPVDKAAESVADSLVQNLGLQDGFVVINPGAGWASRRWPAERFGAVARHVDAKWSLPCVVVWAGEPEQGWAEEIVRTSAGHAVLSPATSLQELASLLRRARLFVGSDTGPMHIAAAVGTSCVSMHGTTPAWQSGPYGEGHMTIQEEYQQGTCRQRRSASNDAMRKITVDRVCQACDQLLERRCGRRSAVA